jgi:hypothetical protein
MGFYTQGIDAKPTEKGLLETLLINRAACNLALGKLVCSALLLLFLSFIALI